MNSATIAFRVNGSLHSRYIGYPNTDLILLHALELIARMAEKDDYDILDDAADLTIDLMLLVDAAGGFVDTESLGARVLPKNAWLMLVSTRGRDYATLERLLRWVKGLLDGSVDRLIERRIAVTEDAI